MTRAQYARRLLPLVGAPVTDRNVDALVAWAQAEGGAARWNPLNTTHDAPGATDYNWVGVKEYPDAETGLKATAETLNYGADRGLYGYQPIRHRLRRNCRPRRTLNAVEKSEWGTGGLAAACLKYVKRDPNRYRKQPVAGSN